MGLKEAVALLENFDNLMVNNEPSLYDKELNKQGWDDEEASWEFKTIKEAKPQE